jgi:hypothetical protein
MAKTTLVAEAREAGRKLLAALDRHTDLGVFAAFWLWDADTEAWRLVFGADAVDPNGPTSALRAVQSILLGLQQSDRTMAMLSLSDILLLGRSDPLWQIWLGPIRYGGPMAIWPDSIQRSLPRSDADESVLDGLYVYRNYPAWETAARERLRSS